MEQSLPMVLKFHHLIENKFKVYNAIALQEYAPSKFAT